MAETTNRRGKIFLLPLLLLLCGSVSSAPPAFSAPSVILPEMRETGQGFAVALASYTVKCAEASNIVSDLRSMKVASLMFYEDNAEEIARGDLVFGIERLLSYMDNTGKFQSGLFLAVEEKRGLWWVGYDLKAAGTSKQEKNKLKRNAEVVGLWGEKNADVPYTGQDIIWMLVR